MGILGAILFAVDAGGRNASINATVTRNSYGEGKRIENFRIKVGNRQEKEPVRAEITERQYTSKQIRKIFSQSVKQMEQWILGKNKSFNKIDSDMELIKEVPGQPIDVEWELDRYDVMNVNGQLQKIKLAKQGTPVQLRATLTYRQNQKEQAQFQCAVMVYPEAASKSKKTVQAIEELIKTADQKEQTKDTVKLPSTIHGKDISYYRDIPNRGVTVLVLAVLIGVLLMALEKQNTYKAEKEEKKQMLLDYPEVVSKLTLLLGAGMTVKNAWRKITSDYEAQKKDMGRRKIYEEMQITLHEMQSGITEAQSYERFGRRCKIQAYIKLGALLSQNLRKGTKGLNELLRIESIQAFEERKANAKRLGEEAGTKLLLPMFVMLALVLIIVVVPAFLSIQL